MAPEEESSNWNSMMEWIEKIVLAFFVALVLFGGFHLMMFSFSIVYKLSVRFHYI